MHVSVFGIPRIMILPCVCVFTKASLHRYFRTTFSFLSCWWWHRFRFSCWFPARTTAYVPRHCLACHQAFAGFAGTHILFFVRSGIACLLLTARQAGPMSADERKAKDAAKRKVVMSALE